MKTIETTATVTPDGTLTARIPGDIAPGQHSVVIVIDEAVGETAADRTSKLPFPVIDVGEWPGDFSLRREDIYGDEGR